MYHHRRMMNLTTNTSMGGSRQHITGTLLCSVNCAQRKGVRMMDSPATISTTTYNLKPLFVRNDSPRGVDVFQEAREDFEWPNLHNDSRKSCMKSSNHSRNCHHMSEETSVKRAEETSVKQVSFDGGIEIREHPRILGDNPCVKKGPALSLGWFQPAKDKVLRFTVDEYEAMRTPQRKKNLVLHSRDRKRLLVQEAGVTFHQMIKAKQEATKIKRSRRHQNAALPYSDDTAEVLETCVRTLQRFVTTGSLSTGEVELELLMEQAERAQMQ